MLDMPYMKWLAQPLRYYMCSNAGGYKPLKHQGDCKDYNR